MPPSNENLQLESQVLETLLRDFESSWEPTRLAERVGQLPLEGTARLRILSALVKVDLRCTWQHGTPRQLESYLTAYPELGTPQTVAVDLIQAEMQARRQAGEPVSWDDLARRFPQQTEQLRRGLEQLYKNPVVNVTPAPTPPPGSTANGAGDPSGTVAFDGAVPSDATLRPAGHTNPDLVLPPVGEAATDGTLAGETPTGGRYLILKELGRGNMGTVYLAQDTYLQRRVALKVPRFREEDGPEMRERFYREARAAAVLDHPNICRVYDVGNANGKPYLTMTYVEGEQLNDVSRRERPMDQHRAAEIVHKLAEALEEAHRAGIIHRDLKPSNVMLNRVGEPIIMDFGLARRLDQDTRLTHKGDTLGTPAYMSPEQVKGEVDHIGPASDQYNLGVILYELLTGRVPFDGGVGQVMAAILTQRPQPPGALRRDLDPKLGAICQRAMAPSPADRYESMAEFANDLAVFLTGEAPPPKKSSKRVPALKPPQAQEGPRKSLARPIAVVVVLFALLGGGIAYLAMTPGPDTGTPAETAEQFRARVQGLIRQEKFVEALDALDGTKHGVEMKTQLAREVRSAALPWAQQRHASHKDLEGALATPERVKELEGALATLERLLDNKWFPGDSNLGPLHDQVAQTYVRQEWRARLTSGRYADAYAFLTKSRFAETDWAKDYKRQTVTAWAQEISTSYKDRKLFQKAAKMAAELLAVEQHHAKATEVKESAEERMREITREVRRQLKQKQFADADTYLKENWPADETNLRGEIVARWADAVRDSAKARAWDGARAQIAELQKWFPQQGPLARTLLGEVGAAQVQAAIDSPTHAALQKAKDILNSPEGKLIGADWPRLNGKVQELLERANAVDLILATLPRKGDPAEAAFRAAAAQLEKLQADSEGRKRITALVGLLRLAADNARDPLGDALARFEAALQPAAGLTKEDRRELESIFDRLLDHRIRKSLIPFAAGKNWQQGLADARKAIDRKGRREPPTGWALAWRVECLAELAQASTQPDKREWESARVALEKHHPDAPAEEAYARYALGLAAVREGKDVAGAGAADWMVKAFTPPDPPGALDSKHRKGRAAAALVADANELREEKNFQEPFGSKANAGRACSWLALAERLDSTQGGAQLPVRLALAAWYKQPRQEADAAKWATQALKTNALDELPESSLDAYLILLVHAATRKGTAADRAETVENYTRALKVARARLSNAPDEGFAQHVFRSIIAPSTAAGGARLLGDRPTKALKDALGHLYARSGRLIRADPYTWSKVKELGDNPVRKVAELYGRAYKLTDKAEHLVQRAFTQSELEAPNLVQLEKDADLARKREPKYWGGHSLKGFAHFLRSHKENDYKGRVAALRKAEGHFTEAAACAAKEKNAEELSLLYRYWSSVCLELGNYALKDPKERETNIRAAVKHARQATRLNQGNLDAWDALAYAQEDVAWILGETTRYEEAKAAFDQAIAISFRKDRLRPWLGRGRILYRWANETRDDAKMKDAEANLDEVIKRAQDPGEIAEANFWQAMIAVSRRERARTDRQKNTYLPTAEEGFKQCYDRARKGLGGDWEEVALKEWANLALDAALTNTGAKQKGYFKQAEDLAARLEKFNVPESFLIRGDVLLRRDFKKKEALSTFLKGVKRYREQDTGSLVRLYVTIALLQLQAQRDVLDVKGSRKNAEAAYREATRARLTRNLRALAAGTLGTSLLVAGASEPGVAGQKILGEALDKFREALDTAPAHPKSPAWRLLFVETVERRTVPSKAASADALKFITELQQAIRAEDPATMRELSAADRRRTRELFDAYTKKRTK
jgi:predicted Ser/Thr protein kinase